jgi:TonB family protein
MQRIRTRLALAFLAAMLSACATAPWRSSMTPVPIPGSLGLGPECGPQPYPFQALQNFVRGQVVVRTQVGTEGRVEGAQVEQAAFDPYLTEAALQAVRSCRMAGTPAGTTVRLLVVYDFYGQSEYLPNGFVNILFVPPGR